ncbi:ABC transporter ATP-binding protein/permease [Falsiroseomonas sp. CW058]|uniref:ABC transporter ATP-binding protein/permease n=1 Tax=Falsiroseomonas sp. CW058 TaxID=3388664 RepID=UPI003D30FD9E
MADETSPPAETGALRDAWRLARNWFAAEPLVAGGLTVAAIGLMLMQLAIDWGFAFWQRASFDALEARDGAAFLAQIGVFAGLIAALMAVNVGRLWSRQILGMRWRRWLVLKLQAAMLTGSRHHRMEIGQGGADNPDQRIGENTRWATAIAVDLVLGFLYAVVLLLSFAGMLWHLSAGFALPLGGGAELPVPGGLLWAALLYAGLCATITWRLGRSLPRIHMDRNAAEGDHRFALVRLRENSEAIALIRGEADERRGLAAAFARVEAAMHRMFRSERALMWLGCCYMPVAGAVAMGLSAPRFFAGAITLGMLMQSAHAFHEVVRALTWFTENWPRLADWRGHVARVVELERACEAAGRPGALRREEGAEQLEVAGLVLDTACGRTLVAEAALTLRPGERVLIMGESGSGKSTLFRAIAGLWPWGGGGLRAPCPSASMFLPQRPYLPLGTLAAALAYPAAPDAFAPEAMRAALLRCRLPGLAGRLAEEARWDRVLSLGEQQRLAFARLLLHRPRWVFLDEATSALDEANQGAMFAALRDLLPDAAVLSIGHRSTLVPHHDRVLAMVPGPGGARLVAVPPLREAGGHPPATALLGLSRRGDATYARRALNPRQPVPSAG